MFKRLFSSSSTKPEVSSSPKPFSKPSPVICPRPTESAFSDRLCDSVSRASKGDIHHSSGVFRK